MPGVHVLRMLDERENTAVWMATRWGFTREELLASGEEADWELFLLANLAELAPENILTQPVWRTVGEERRLALWERCRMSEVLRAIPRLLERMGEEDLEGLLVAMAAAGTEELGEEIHRLIFLLRAERGHRTVLALLAAVAREEVGAMLQGSG